VHLSSVAALRSKSRVGVSRGYPSRIDELAPIPHSPMEERPVSEYPVDRHVFSSWYLIVFRIFIMKPQDSLLLFLYGLFSLQKKTPKPKIATSLLTEYLYRVYSENP
jgi:hypothetical protein